MTLTMAVVVDYQNVHLTGASLFLPGRPPEEGLIDPASPASLHRRVTPRSLTNGTRLLSSVSRSSAVCLFPKTIPTPTDATKRRRPSGSAGTTEWSG